MKNKKHYIIMSLIIISIILLDQIIKIAIIKQNGTETILLDGILKLDYNENKGIAFGIGNGDFIGVVLTNILVVSILFRFLIKQIENMNYMARISLSIIIAGGISNLIDRLVRGKVIDYIDISQIISSFPIFNLADVSIIIGFILFVFTVGIDLIKMRPRKLGGEEI